MEENEKLNSPLTFKLSHVARMIGCSERALRIAIKDKHLKAMPGIKKPVRIAREEVERFIAEGISTDKEEARLIVRAEINNWLLIHGEE